jgi:hypothetical protein
MQALTHVQQRRVGGRVRAVLPFAFTSSCYAEGPSPCLPLPIPSVLIDDEEGNTHTFVCGDHEFAKGDPVNVIYEWQSFSLWGHELFGWWGMTGFEKAS